MRIALPLLLLLPFAALRGEPADGRLLVLNKGAASAWLLDPASGERLAAFETGEGPHEAAVSPDGRLAVVCDYGGREPGRTLTVIDLEEGAVARTVELGELARPHGIAFLSDGRRVVVTAEAARSIAVVDVVLGEVVGRAETGERVSHMLALSHDETRAYVANIGSGTASVVDLEELELLRNVPTGAGCEGIAVRPGTGEVWTTNREADTLSVVDPETLEVTAEIAVEGFPIRVAFTPDGARALVTCPRAGDVAVLDAETREVAARVPLDLERAEGADEGLFGDAFGESPAPIGVVVRPDGRAAYVAASNADVVAVLDLEDLAFVRVLPTGREPDGMAWVPVSPR